MWLLFQSEAVYVKPEQTLESQWFIYVLPKFGILLVWFTWLHERVSSRHMSISLAYSWVFLVFWAQKYDIFGICL